MNCWATFTRPLRGLVDLLVAQSTAKETPPRRPATQHHFLIHHRVRIGIVKTTILLSTLLFLSFITVLAQQPPAVRPESGTWVNVAPDNSGFTVLMPGKAAEQSQPLEGHPDLANHLLTLETDIGGYVVSYLEFPDDVTDPDRIKLMLDRGREGGIASSGGELVSETEIKLSGYFGREWSMKLPGGLTATARAYWVRRQLFQTVFVKSPKANDSPEVIRLRQQAETKFLDSFALIGDPK